MPDWLNVAAAIAGIAATGLALWGLYYAAFHYFDRRLTRNPDYRRARTNDLRHPRVAHLYEDWLDGALRFLGTLMGTPWSARAFGVCLTVGLLYSFLLLLVSWGFFGGAGTLGPTPLLPEWSDGWRATSATVLLLYLSALYYLARRLGGWADRQGTLLAALGAKAGVMVLVFAGIMALGGALIGFVSAAAALIIVSFAGPITSSGSKTMASAGIVAGCVAVAVVVPLALLSEWSTATDYNLKDDRTTQGLVLFVVILPVANALWDWMSWWVSRGLGQHLLDTIRRPDLGLPKKAWAGLLHAAADFGLAVIFLVLFARTLPWAIQQFNAFVDSLGGASPFELTDYLCAAAQEPWTTGLWAMLMLLSTLVPTALHATAALASPLAAVALWLQRDEKLARRLTMEPPGSAGFDSAVDDAAAHLALTWIGVWVLAGALVTAAFVGLLWLGSLVTGELPEPLPGSLRESCSASPSGIWKRPRSASRAGEARLSWLERLLAAAVGTALLWPTGPTVNVPGFLFFLALFAFNLWRQRNTDAQPAPA